MNSTLSFWERDAFFDNTDVAIVGSGIVGLNAAISLKKKHPKLKVVVLERNTIGMGASSKNAGFACFGSPGELLEDLEMQGEDIVFSLVEKRWKGLQLLRKSLGDKTIDFYKWGGYEVFSSKDAYERCRDQLSYLNKQVASITGNKEVYKDASGMCPKFGFKGVEGMLLNSEEGQIDTGRMIIALLMKAQHAGVIIMNGFDVRHFEDQGEHVTITSSEGPEFQTRRLLICNNGFVKGLLPDLPVHPARAQVLITRPIANLKLKGTFHYDKGYYYFRNIGNRILFGGARNLDFKTEETDAYGLTDIIQTRLEDLLQNMIVPYALSAVEMRWSGIMGVGPEKTTIIKAISKNVFCAVRMGGMGVAIGTLVGQEAATLAAQSL
jgi:gamma-glutamylputrescine oxidase